MLRFVGVCAALMAMFVTGESLICHTCKVGLGDKCLYSSSMTCSDAQQSCYWGKLVFNVSRLMTLNTRGCIASSLCNQTQTGALLNAAYTITTTCCSTDCCNGATSIQVSLTAALGATLTAVWSTWSL